MSRTSDRQGKCCSYIWYNMLEAKSVVNKNSIYETKTISGDLLSEKKTNNNNEKV